MVLGLLAGAAAIEIVTAGTHSEWPRGQISNLIPLDAGDVIALMDGTWREEDGVWLVRADGDLGVRWRRSLPGSASYYSYQIAVGAGLVALRHGHEPDLPGELSVHDLETGQLVWTTPSEFPGVSATPSWITIRDALLLEFGPTADSDESIWTEPSVQAVKARDLRTGTARWQSTAPASLLDVEHLDEAVALSKADMLTLLQLRDGTREDHERPRGRSLCRDGQRLFIAGATDLFRLPTEPGAAPEHVWALPPPLVGADITRCGHYQGTTVLTFERSSSSNARGRRPSDAPAAEEGLRGLQDLAAVALLFIDEATGQIAGTLDLGALVDGAAIVCLSSICQEAMTGDQPAARCPLNGELSRFVPLTMLAAMGSGPGTTEVLRVDLETRRAHRLETVSDTFPPRRWLRSGVNAYVAADPAQGSLFVFSGESGVLRRYRSPGERVDRAFVPRAPADGTSVWLMLNTELVRFEPVTGAVQARAFGGRMAFDMQVMNVGSISEVHLEPVSARADDILPLPIAPNAGGAKGTDPHLGR